jgi:hypothetical protein
MLIIRMTNDNANQKEGNMSVIKDHGAGVRPAQSAA